MDVCVDPGPLSNVLTTPPERLPPSSPHGFPILLTQPPSSLGLSVPTALRDLKLWHLVECPSPDPPPRWLEVEG